MNFERFIANRVISTKQKSFARIIIRIAIASVALSTIVMIMTLAIMTGFKNQITEKIFGFWGHIHVTDTYFNKTFELEPIKNDLPYLETIKDIGQVEIEVYSDDVDSDETTVLTSNAGVKHVQSFAVAAGILKSKKSDFETILLKGVGLDFDWSIMNKSIKRGNALQMSRDTASKDIVISNYTAKRLKVDVGDQLIYTLIKQRAQIKRRFDIVGVYQTGLEEYDKRFALVDIRKVQNIVDWEDNEVAGFEVFLEDINDMDIINRYIDQEVVPIRLQSETIRSKFPEIFDWLDLQKLNERMILGLMIMVAIINMITAILILILEKVRTIGVLKSLGASSWRIRKIFLYQAGHIIGWGLLLGNVIGLGLCFFQKYTGLLKLEEENYYLDTVPIEINFISIVVINILALMIILIALIIPTYLVTKITPIKSLKFD